MAKLMLFFSLLLISPCRCFLLLQPAETLGKIATRRQSLIRLHSSNEHPSPAFGAAAGQYKYDKDLVVQRQIDAYLEERSQRQIEQYVARLSKESSDILLLSEEELSSNHQDQEEDDKNLMQKIKDSGVAGIVAFAIVQFGFWVGTFPFIVLAFYKVTGHFPDFNSQEDMAFFGGESFAFVNVLRLAAPFRIGFALKLVPWIQENVIDRFKKRDVV
mmetsp:Transcript_526/g.873  ORF Transcript_526/g.873 Transcript_526/m.873 type:complete len:216 (-) Transcript_526:174-821(-)